MTTRPLVYRGGHLLTQDSVLGEVVGDLLIDKGRIAAVGADLVVPESAEVIDATDLVILPGFIDTHRHMWETALRGACVWQDYSAYVRIVRKGFGSLMTPDDAYAGDLLGALGALESGITAVRDESHVQNSPAHTEAVLQALVDAGGRAVLAYGWPAHAIRPEENERRRPLYISEVLIRGSTTGGGLVSFAMMGRGAEGYDGAAAAEDVRYARELGLRTSFHVGGAGIEPLARMGLLGPDLLFIHCTRTSDEELRMIGDVGASTSVAAYIELAMPGIGAPSTTRMVAAGVRPSLSIDAEPSSPGDMFSVMRAVLLAETAAEVFTGTRASVTLTERDVLAFATIEGARACGLADEVGSLTPGKAADVIVIDPRQLGLAAATDPAVAVVDYGHPAAVIDVLVAGRYVKRAGRMVDTALVDRAVSAAERSRDRLVAQRHV